MWTRFRQRRKLPVKLKLRFALAMLLLWGWSSTHAFNPDHISLQLQWKHQFQFAGYYVARELGFYKEAGLDVDIREYRPGIDVLEDVVNGRSDFGSGRVSLILHSDRGILMMAAIYQSSPFVLLSKRRDNLKTLHDIAGKKLMLSDSLADIASIFAMLKAEGIDTETMHFLPHSLDIKDLIDGKVDLISAYISNEPYLLQERHIPYTVFDPRDYGFDFYGDILFTTKRFAEKYPDVTRRFYEATLKGWAYAFAHIPETAKLIRRKYNTQHKSLQALIYEGETLKKLALLPDVPFGKIDNVRLREIENSYRLLGFGQFKKNDFDDMIYSGNKADAERLVIERKWIVLMAMMLLFVIGLLILNWYLSLRENRLLQSSLERFELLIESTIEGILIFDEEGVCLRANSVAGTLFRYRQEAMRGVAVTALLCPESVEIVKRRMQVPNQEPYETKLRRRDGTCFTAIVRGRDMVWENQKIRVSTVIDISEMKALQKKLQSLNENLETKVAEQVEDIRQRDQMLLHQSKLASMGEMIGAIAHQWRQPLNALNINIQNLDDDYAEGLIDADFIDRFIAKNREIITYMSKTIDDFRNFFRIDKTKESFSIKEAIETTMALQHAQLLKRDITLSVEGEDIFVTGYRHEFLQVLLNLINNAVDQLHKKWVQNPKITIRLKEDALILEDNAGGIDPKIIDRIFEPYFTTKAQGEGTGLGLYIAKVIIEKNLGGRLEARNNIRGALFEITFPKEAIIYLKQRAAPALES